MLSPDRAVGALGWRDCDREGECEVSARARRSLRVGRGVCAGGAGRFAWGLGSVHRARGGAVRDRGERFAEGVQRLERTASPPGWRPDSWRALWWAGINRGRRVRAVGGPLYVTLASRERAANRRVETPANVNPSSANPADSQSTVRSPAHTEWPQSEPAVVSVPNATYTALRPCSQTGSAFPRAVVHSP